jgi:hypothetical protein
MEQPKPPESTKTNTNERVSAEVSPRLIAATEQRIALVIGNSSYNSGPLKNPVNDATAIADKLKKLGFTVTLQKNAKQQEMDESIREFGRQLKRTHGVGLFFYAGHGMQVGGVNYLLPVNARIEKESDVRFNAINADMVLAEMENAENGLNIVILDACRDNPFARSFRNATRGLAIISNAPSGTFISYSTGANQVARDGDGNNSPYTKALLENMDKPGLTINSVFMKVRGKVMKETGQVPWELSSLVGDFYFVPGNISQTAAAVKQETNAIDDGLQAERIKVEEERKQLAMAKRPSVSIAKEIRRDGSFIAYDNGTVLDTRTNLIWASKDNGFDINWMEAKSYCENYRGGAYTDWRMPTLSELAGLYDRGNNYQSECRATFWGTYDIHITELMHLTCAWTWTSETLGPNATLYNYYDGFRYSYPHATTLRLRVLPVRSGK